MRKVMTSAIALAAISIAISPALAQKSKDTIRLTILDPFTTLDSYHFPANQPGQYTRAMYGKLLQWDEHKGKFIPELAKSWKRINPTTIEFELRDDVKYTSGNKFSAKDVKYMVEYIGDPKLKIRFKGRYTWIKEARIISPTRIQIIAKKPRGDDMMILAYRYYMYDSEVHSKMKDKAAYGRLSASTTGAYKLVSINRNTGVKLTRNDEAVAKFPHLRAPIKNIHGIPIPDSQTQLASLLTGAVDVLQTSSQDTVRQFEKNPNYNVTPFATRMLTYITLDAAGRSKNKAFKDIRVRQAFIKAIDRDKIINTFMPGGKSAVRPDSVCFAENIACTPSTKPLGYDPEGAKKLLADAGFPNGLNIELSAFAPMTELTQAIAGDLRKVGIRATVQGMPLPVYTKRRGAGELTALMARYPTFAQPNTSNIMNFFFAGNRDYSADPVIQAARKAGSSVMDIRERAKIYQKAMDRVNTQAYILPFAEQPNVYIHSKDVEIKTGLISMTETRPTDYFWK